MKYCSRKGACLTYDQHRLALRHYIWYPNQALSIIEWGAKTIRINICLLWPVYFLLYESVKYWIDIQVIVCIRCVNQSVYLNECIHIKWVCSYKDWRKDYKGNELLILDKCMPSKWLWFYFSTIIEIANLTRLYEKKISLQNKGGVEGIVEH